ncbi:MAG: AtpZ/AtpI family protein [Chloroflexi bacterium]|nr:MAG: AtpZ/AtpI family protein [Chloroflexota bacterium]
MPMTEPGQAGAYLALFSEIGFVLLVATLLGALGGYWIDKQLGSLPILTIVGFLAGAAIGARAMYRLVTRFLARFD